MTSLPDLDELEHLTSNPQQQPAERYVDVVNSILSREEKQEATVADLHSRVAVLENSFTQVLRSDHRPNHSDLFRQSVPTISFAISTMALISSVAFIATGLGELVLASGFVSLGFAALGCSAWWIRKRLAEE